MFARCAARAVRSPHAILGVPQNCDLAEVKRAFLRKVKSTHPDVAQGDSSQFVEVKAAYEAMLKAAPRVRRRGGPGGLYQQMVHHHGWPGAPAPRRPASPTPPSSPPPPKQATADVRCGLCNSTPTVPARLNIGGCKCAGRAVYCLTCLRDALGLNGVTRGGRQGLLTSCQQCGTQFPEPPASDSAYTIDEELMAHLDESC
eukprot:Sspe_Gene.12438::Locus_4239_Transcript_1_1_Confidence_1.000_Length_670::g.12438::m.12438